MPCNVNYKALNNNNIDITKKESLKAAENSVYVALVHTYCYLTRLGRERYNKKKVKEKHDGSNQLSIRGSR